MLDGRELMLTLAVVIAAGSDAAAQGSQGLPSFDGQWAGPYELDMTQGVDSSGGPTTYPGTMEIVHAAVLPPTTDPLDRQTRVVFQARHGFTNLIEACACDVGDGEFVGSVPGDGWGRAFVWRPRVPTATQLIDAAPFNQDGSEMLFCGGHTFLPDGDLFWVGGTDGLAMCDTACNIPPQGPTLCYDEPPLYASHPQCGSTPLVPFVGNRNAWRLVTGTALPTWTRLPAPPYGRWYPTVITLPSNRMMVAGHLSAPFDGQGKKRVVYDLNTTPAIWTAPQANQPPGLTTACAPYDDHDHLDFLDYPRLHVVSTGHVIHTNPNDGEICAPILASTRVLDLDPNTNPCPTDPRWELGAPPNDVRLNGSSVHVIGFDETTGEFKEAIYRIGGSIEEFEGLPCQCDEDPSTITGAVEKFIPDPTFSLPDNPATDWYWDASPADLNYSRVNHNGVILADGSILVVGGEATVSTGAPGVTGGEPANRCVSRKIPERYLPLEIFPNANNVWQELTPQAVDRRYHSVAGLLPSGRVFCAGGANLNHVDNPEGPKSGNPDCEISSCMNQVSDDPTEPWDVPDHSVEVYSPPYMFRPRPQIDKTTLNDPRVLAYDHGQPISFSVTMPAGTSVKRVALIKSCSTTHAFDMSQRYVELEVTFNTAGAGPRERDLTVNAPLDENWAPDGFYMLVVVDDNFSTPSPAAWVKIGT